MKKFRKAIIATALLCLMLLSQFLTACDIVLELEQPPKQSLETPKESTQSSENSATEEPTESEKDTTPIDYLQHLTFTKLENGTYSVKLKEGSSLEYIEIPDTYEGMPVTKISSRAFQNNSILQKIKLKEGLLLPT